MYVCTPPIAGPGCQLTSLEVDRVHFQTSPVSHGVMDDCLKQGLPFSQEYPIHMDSYEFICLVGSDWRISTAKWQYTSFSASSNYRGIV
jgi:hypothetical protein